MAALTSCKTSKTSDVLCALELSDFDALRVLEVDDSDTDGEEVISFDVTVDGK